MKMFLEKQSKFDHKKINCNPSMCLIFFLQIYWLFCQLVSALSLCQQFLNARLLHPVEFSPVCRVTTVDRNWNFKRSNDNGYISQASFNKKTYSNSLNVYQFVSSCNLLLNSGRCKNKGTLFLVSLGWLCLSIIHKPGPEVIKLFHTQLS